MSKLPVLYGLMYVGDKAERHINLTASSPIDVYLLNAVLLWRSAKAAGMDLRLITNKPNALAEALTRLAPDAQVPLVEIDFPRDVPADIPFRSAHYKLDVLAAFARGELGDLVGLIDLDVVVLAPFSCDDSDALYVYDINKRQVGTFGHQQAAKDVELLSGLPPVGPCWYGGEFIVGSPVAFARLVHEIEQIWPAYLSHQGQLHHSGDEMVVNAALARIMRSDLRVLDVGQDKVIHRWWSSRTTTPMDSWLQSSDNALLHLPADKNFLAEQATQPFAVDRFLVAHLQYARKNRWVALAKNLADLLRGRRWQYLPKVN